MNREARELKEKIKRANNILIITHKGPDFDAFCSSLILKECINTYYPRKNVVFKSRQMPTQNIPRMDEISVVESIHPENEDLVIITDAGSMSMCITHSDTIQNTKAKLVIIDHHDTQSDESDLTINNNMSSATEQILTLVEAMAGRRFKITESISKLGQIGLITDTNRFLNENTTPLAHEWMAKLKRIFNFDIEEFTYKNGKFPFEMLVPLQVYVKNMRTEGDMAYTYISKEDIEGSSISKTAVNSAHRFVKDNIIRNIHGVHWGFVIKPSFVDDSLWQVSFRSTKGYQKVDKIAEALGGGGHEYASAARIKGLDSDEVLYTILNEIKRHLSS